MFAVSTYEEIEKAEREVENNEIVVFLFVRATETKILNEFEYLHYNSGEYCSIYAIGYTNDFQKETDRSYRKVPVNINSDWYFSVKAFVQFKEKLQKRIKWEYSGETEILVLQNNPGKPNALNFQNYVSINIDNGIREKIIDSFQSFMEALIRSSKTHVSASAAIEGVCKEKNNIKSILDDAIDDSKKIPTPVKKIIKNKLFYRSANRFHLK